MMPKFRITYLITYAFFLHFFFVHIPAAISESKGSLTGQIRATVEKVLVILENSSQNPNLNGEEKEILNARTEMTYRNEIRQAIASQFDFPEMAKRSLGLNWRRRSADEQEQFVVLFTDLLEDFFSEKIKSFEDEKFVYLNEIQDGKYAKVDTMIVTKEGEEITINYMFHLADGKWKVYDMVIEHVSLVKNYRSQFNRIIANASYQELVRRIKRVTRKKPSR